MHQSAARERPLTSATGSRWVVVGWNVDCMAEWGMGVAAGYLLFISVYIFSFCSIVHFCFVA